MVRPLANNEYNKHASDEEKRDGIYSYSPAEIQDLAALHAYNAILIRESVHLGVALSEKRGVSFDKIYGSSEYQAAFTGFVGSLADKMTNDPTSSVRDNGRQLMDQIIGRIQ
jgi:hypothetical protein